MLGCAPFVQYSVRHSTTKNMKLFVCVWVLAYASAVYGNILPTSVSDYLCHRADPNLNDCLLKNAGKLLKSIADGIPSAKIDSVDPLYVDFFTSEGDLENVKVNMIMKNITLYGVSSAKFNNITFDPEKLTGEVSVHVPHMRMTCEYYATGRLFVLPLESSAYFDGDYEKTDITLNIKAKEVKRKGVTYYSVDKITEKYYCDKSKIKLTSIVPDEQPSVNVIQNFYNQNDRLVLDTVNPLVVRYGPECLTYAIERFLRRVPAEELFPQ